MSYTVGVLFEAGGKPSIEEVDPRMNGAVIGDRCTKKCHPH